MSVVYLILAVAGTALPYSELLPFLVERGPDARLFLEHMFANRIAGFFALDVIVSSVALWVFVFAEGRRLAMRHLWVYVACNLAIGVSAALPLFLALRGRALTSRA